MTDKCEGECCNPYSAHYRERYGVYPTTWETKVVPQHKIVTEKTEYTPKKPTVTTVEEKTIDGLAYRDYPPYHHLDYPPYHNRYLSPYHHFSLPPAPKEEAKKEETPKEEAPRDDIPYHPFGPDVYRSRPIPHYLPLHPSLPPPRHHSYW